MRARQGRVGVTDPRSGLCFHAQMTGAMIGQTAPRRERPRRTRRLHPREPRRPWSRSGKSDQGRRLLSLTWPTSGPPWYACSKRTHIEPGSAPGLPARTGVLNARDPTSVTSWWGLLYCHPVASMFSASASIRVIDTPSARHKASSTVTVMGAVCPSSARTRISRERETPDRFARVRCDMRCRLISARRAAATACSKSCGSNAVTLMHPIMDQKRATR